MNKIAVLHDYLHYYLSAKTRYDVHSPFVYDFICNVVNKKTKSVITQEIEFLRKQLLKDNKIISVEDFGAGSVKCKCNERKVSQIASHSLKSRKYASLLYRMVGYFKPGSILELGTSLGITTCYLAKAITSSNVVSIEGSKEISNIAESNSKKLGLSNIEFVVGNFDNVLKSTLEKHRPDFIFFDGNHSEEATMRYFETCLPNNTNNSIFVFDDINWSEGMKKAWKRIVANNLVTATVDLHFLGIAFFRKELSKEHFVIRF